MKLVIEKNDLTVGMALISYVSVLLHSVVGTITTRYAMYAVVILMSLFVTFQTRGYHGVLQFHPGVWLYLIIVEVITVLTQAHRGEINVGSIIQPFFLISIFCMGYRIRGGNERQAKKVLFFLFAIFLFAAVVGIPEYFSHSNIFFPDYGNPWQTYRVSSLYHHPLMYSTMLSIGFWISIYLIKNRILKLFSLIVFTFGIFASLSRSSWIAWLIVIAYVILSKFRSRITKKMILSGIATVFIITFFFQTNYGEVLIDTISSRFSNLSKDLSSTQRLGTIAYIQGDIVNNINPLTFLLGHGEDSAAYFMLNTVIDIENFSSTDNQYLLIFYNYGAIALFIVIKVIFDVNRIIFARYAELSAFSRCVYASLAVFAITAFFYEITETKICCWVMVLCIGFMVYEVDERGGRILMHRKRLKSYSK